MLPEILSTERRHTKARAPSGHPVVKFDALRDALLVFGFFELSKAWMELYLEEKTGDALVPEDLERMNVTLEAIVMGAPA